MMRSVESLLMVATCSHNGVFVFALKYFMKFFHWSPVCDTEPKRPDVLSCCICDYPLDNSPIMVLREVSFY